MSARFYKCENDKFIGNFVEMKAHQAANPSHMADETINTGTRGIKKGRQKFRL